MTETGTTRSEAVQGSPLRALAWVIPLLILLFAFPMAKPPLFFLALFFSMFMYVGLAESWNLMGGYTGYVSLGHVAFFTTGAYTTAVMMNVSGCLPLQPPSSAVSSQPASPP